MCQIIKSDGSFVDAEVVGFKEDNVLLMPFQETVGIAPGSRVRLHPKPFSVKVGPQILGRILDGMGNPIDGFGPLNTKIKQPVYNKPPDPLNRQSVDKIMETGVRSIDGFTTIGKGQRMGIFAGSGVGKSVLLSILAKQSKADVNVIALIGERGREVKEFIDKNLGEEGLKKSVIIVSTSDQAPMLRLKAALTATAISEYFRDQGKDVMFMMDSLTRVAMAQREIGLAVGEPPTTKGYTPSVFSLLPKIIERAGNGTVGSITGLYTILIEGILLVNGNREKNKIKAFEEQVSGIKNNHLKALAYRIVAIIYFNMNDYNESQKNILKAQNFLSMSLENISDINQREKFIDNIYIHKDIMTFSDKISDYHLKMTIQEIKSEDNISKLEQESNTFHKFCTNCGNKNSNNYKFCTNCGNNLTI